MITKEKTVADIADEIMQLYGMYGSNDYPGEPALQIKHMCQCAELAQEESCDDEIILAAFFHDIGHLLEHVLPAESTDDYGFFNHEKIGADYLAEKGFSKKITKLIASHAESNRYLTYKYPGYYDELSEASKKNLAFHGGIMSKEDAKLFEGNDLFILSLLLRSWDEKARQENKPLPDLITFRDMITQHLYIGNSRYVSIELSVQGSI